VVSIARHFFMSGDSGAQDPELTKFVVADAVDFVERMAEEGGRAWQILLAKSHVAFILLICFIPFIEP